MGLKYLYQGNVYDFSGTEYDPGDLGTVRLRIKKPVGEVKLGLTTDPSASSYSPLKFRLANNVCYIGKSGSSSSSTSDSGSYTSSKQPSATAGISSTVSASQMQSTSSYSYSSYYLIEKNTINKFETFWSSTKKTYATYTTGIHASSARITSKTSTYTTSKTIIPDSIKVSTLISYTVYLRYSYTSNTKTYSAQSGSKVTMSNMLYTYQDYMYKTSTTTYNAPYYKITTASSLSSSTSTHNFI